MPELFPGKFILEDFSNPSLMSFGARFAEELQRVIREHKPKVLEISVKYNVIKEDFVNAAEDRFFERNNQQQHQDGDRPREAAETSGRDLSPKSEAE